MANYGMDMPEELVHRADHEVDAGLALWSANQRLIFLDEEIEETEQRLVNLRRRRTAQVHRVTALFERYFEVRDG